MTSAPILSDAKWRKIEISPAHDPARPLDDFGSPVSHHHWPVGARNGGCVWRCEDQTARVGKRS